MIAARPLGCLQSNSNFEHLPGVATLELGEASRCPAPTVTTQAALGATFSRRRYQSEDLILSPHRAWRGASGPVMGWLGLILGTSLCASSGPLLPQLLPASRRRYPWLEYYVDTSRLVRSCLERSGPPRSIRVPA